MNRDESLLQGNETYKIKEKRLSSAVLADDKPNSGTAIGNRVKVCDKCFYFSRPSNLNVLQSGSRHYTRHQSLNKCLPLFRTNNRCCLGTHVVITTSCISDFAISR